MQAREELAKIYFFLVEAETRRMLARLPIRAYWEKKEDLGSAGVIGLLQALDHFVPPKEKKMTRAGHLKLMQDTGFEAKWSMSFETWILHDEI